MSSDIHEVAAGDLIKHEEATRLLRTQEDYQLVNRLLNQVTRYKIPERLRDKVINCIDQTISNEHEPTDTKLTAIRVLSTLEKHNIDLVKMSMPKRVETFDAKSATDEELLAAIKEVHKLLPPTFSAES